MSALVLARRALLLLTGLVSLVAAWAALAPLLDLPGPVGGAYDRAWPHLVLALFVAVLGSTVAAYATANLRGQRRQRRFAALLVTLVAGLVAMVATPSLPVTAVGWTASGMALAALVAHRGDERALRASRLVRRRLLAGDVAMWAAVLVQLAGGPTEAVGALLAVACVVRSALVPFQRWLPETAEAPSPVSALLHAGVVNGGAAVCLLQWEVVGASRAALLVLLVAGASSVVLGLAAMRLRPDLKGRLAASTSAQMGLVAVQLGLGLPAVAFIHVLGHGAWKAWLFLRAGGAVARAAEAPRRAEVAARTVVAASGAVFGAVLAGALVLGAAAQAPAGLGFSAVLVAGAAAVATAEAVRLGRVSARARVGLVLGGLLLPVAYLAWLVLLDGVLHDWFVTPGAGAAGWSVGWVAAAAAAGAVVLAGVLVAGLAPDSRSPVATVVASTLLPPGHRSPGIVGAAGPGPTPDLGGLPAEAIDQVIRLAAMSVAPAWPLRSMVAANPLAGLEQLDVEDAAAVVRRLHGRDPRPGLDLFLDLHARGVIADHGVRRALEEWSRLRDDAPAISEPDELVVASRAALSLPVEGGPSRVRACDTVRPRRGRSRPLGDVLDVQAAAWTARAWRTTPRPDETQVDPWTLWLGSARSSAYDWAWGVAGASRWARTLPDDPGEALLVLWPRVRQLVAGVDAYSYLSSLLAAGPGWAAHAAWRGRQRGDTIPLVQLLALRMALDVLIAEAAGVPTGSPSPRPGVPDRRDASELVAVWQRALDLSARDGLLRALDPAAGRRVDGPTVRQPARVQSVWCIDARSEQPRRALEARGGHETFGFAGFFGAALRHHDADGTVTDRCPGLLSPTASTFERPVPLGLRTAVHRVVTGVGQHPAAAFAFAEASGLPALGASLAATVAPHPWRRLTRWFLGTSVPRPRPVDGMPLDVAVDAAAALLGSTGLGTPTGRLLVLVGHRSSTENNAFASAYDCGACGGNSGTINATVMARALNDPEVRAALARRGLPVPPDLLVVAAEHDTTADTVVLLREPGESEEVRSLLDAAQRDLDGAGHVARERRALHLPDSGRPASRRRIADRAADWSEPMPEWGLAGNLALVVGPRALTEHLDLGGTAFLHSYDPATDPDGAVLEQLMNGPVLVTQWINSQYHASTAAPDLFGAGDKTTHNVVGDVGVLTGAHGDLRLGLPWQAVASSDPLAPGSDSTGLRHLPARHLVVLVARPAAVLDVVRRHAPLRRAVAHGWMQLVVLPPGEDTLLELDRGLSWRACPPLPAPAASAPASGDASRDPDGGRGRDMGAHHLPPGLGSPRR